MDRIELGSTPTRPYRVGLGSRAVLLVAAFSLVAPLGFVPSTRKDGVGAVVVAIVVGEALMVPTAAWLRWWSRTGVWVSSAGVDLRSPRRRRLRWQEIQCFYVASLSESARPLDRIVAIAGRDLESVAVRLRDGKEVVLGSLNAKSAVVLGGSPPSEIVERLNACIPRTPNVR